jgi:oligoendopeptidase F
MKTETKQQAKRSDIPKEMTWNLDILYSDDKIWEQDLASLDALIEKFMSYKGRLAESAEVLAEAIKSEDELDRLLEKIYVYAHLKSDEDTGNSKSQAKLDIISAKYAEIQGITAWFTPEILAIPEAQFKDYLNSPALSFYHRTLEELERERPHVLSEKEERILGMSSEVFSTPHKTFSMLNNADLRFPEINDENGNSVELTHGNYINFMESNNREIRKSAFEAMYDTFGKYRNTLGTTLDGTVKGHVLNAKLRNYPSALEASLHSDNVPVEVYNNLIKTVHEHLPSLYDYFKLRAEVMKLEKLDMFDIYNPLVPDCKQEISWQQACDWVLAALKPMGEEYCSIVQKALNERWIDVLECKGKRSGAYSSGCYDSVPYILMNFNGTLSDVFTLAHEMGHSLHSYYSNHNQEYHYADYEIFVAEVASTTNELLLHHYLMEQSTDKNFKTYLLNHLADQIRGTIYRQTMFSEFEKSLHERSEKNIPLTAEELCESYFELNSKYHGDNVKPDQRIEMEWARIPHFYYNFYVYKYATGLSAAATLSQNILSGDQQKLEAYFGFLKAGDSKDVLDIMLDAGVDLRTPDPICNALLEFKEAVNELRRNLI